MSGLRARIQHTTGQARANPFRSLPGHPPGQLDSRLQQRIDRLRARGPAPGAGRKRTSDGELAARLGGRVLAAGVLVLERFIPHGDTPNAFPPLRSPRTDELKALGVKVRDPAKELAYLDTETTGLSGGTGTTAFMVGLARHDEDGLKLTQYLLTRFAGESEMLHAVSSALANSRVLVSYNGKSFDRPLLSTRYRLCGLADPLSQLTDLDLLHPTRRAFGKIWPDCRLSTAESRLLGRRRKGDLPGAHAPEAWADWLRHGKDERLPAVSRHNYLDLVALAALIPGLAASFKDPANNGADVVGCLDQATNDEAQRLTYLRTHRRRLSARGLLELARLSRRAGDWKLAASVWAQLARDDNPRGLENLAKYFEHRMGDPGMALEYTRRLMVLEREKFAHRRRARRLRSKLAGRTQYAFGCR